jgi:hypothetical protein
MTRPHVVLRFVAAALVATVARAGADVAPLGNEFQVNTYTTSSQSNPAVTATDTGFVIVWSSGAYYGGGQDGSGSGVFGQRYDASGVRQGAEFRVNTFTSGFQSLSSIAADPSGDFVVAWTSGSGYYGTQQDGSAGGVFLQRFSAAGASQGSEQRANTTTRGRQTLPAVARDATGAFVVVWQSGGYRFTQDGSNTGIFGQRFDNSGSKMGPEFQVNTFTTGAQSRPVVATSPLGDFVITWQSGYYGVGQDGSASGIFARRFNASGTPLGPEFQVNTYTTGPQLFPAVASDALGDFVIVWQSGSYGLGQDGDGAGIFGQRYDSAGLPVGTEFQVNTYTTDNQRQPSVGSDADGNFVVAWESGYYQQGIFGQHFAASGVPIGPEFQVNTYTSDGQFGARVAATPGGNFVVSFVGDYGQDGSGNGVFGRRFRTSAFTPPDTVAGNRLVLRDNADPRRKSLSMRADDVAIDLGAGENSIDDPTLSGGHLFVRLGNGSDATYELPAAYWSVVGSGPSRGYQYRDSALIAGPIKSIRIRRGRFKAVGRGAQLVHSLATNPTPVTLIMQIGDRGQRYCTQYGGTIEYKPGVVYRGRNAPAPSSCPR